MDFSASYFRLEWSKVWEMCFEFLLLSFLGLIVLDIKLTRANYFVVFTWPIFHIHIIGNLFYDFCDDERDKKLWQLLFFVQSWQDNTFGASTVKFWLQWRRLHKSGFSTPVMSDTTFLESTGIRTTDLQLYLIKPTVIAVPS